MSNGHITLDGSYHQLVEAVNRVPDLQVEEQLVVGDLKTGYVFHKGFMLVGSVHRTGDFGSGQLTLNYHNTTPQQLVTVVQYLADNGGFR